MPGGHTERATINARRPLTPGMRELLVELRMGGVNVYCDQAGENRMRGLMDRGFAHPPETSDGDWQITDAGRAFLETE